MVYLGALGLENGAFFGDLISSRFLEGIWPRFGRVFGSFFGSFFGCVGSLFRCACGSGKCGLDTLFAMNQAHGHLPTQAEKIRKYANFGGRFLDSLWDGILGYFPGKGVGLGFSLSGLRSVGWARRARRINFAVKRRSKWA